MATSPASTDPPSVSMGSGIGSPHCMSTVKVSS